MSKVTYKTQGRYSYGWTDPRGVFDYGSKLERWNTNFFDPNYVKVADELRHAPVDTLIGLWNARFEDGKVSFKDLTKLEMDDPIFKIGTVLSQRLRLNFDANTDTYYLTE
jgi:hypothetical protein